MRKRKRHITFHGMFKSKARAIVKENKVNGFIRKCKIRGSVRYMVMKYKGE